MITVQFKDVGRDKRSWSIALAANPLSTDSIEHAVACEAKRGGRLMSSGVEAEMANPDGGVIIVGGFRVVGTFAIVDAPADPATGGDDA